MKKIIITCTIALSAVSISNAQVWIPSGSDGVTNTGVTNIGIDDNTPNDKLSVNGNIGFTASSGIYRFIRGRSSTHGMVLFGDSEFDNGAGITIESNANGGTVSLINGDGGASNDPAFLFRSYGSGTYPTIMRINKNGNVGINETDPTDRLTVGGNIGFSEISGGFNYINGRSDKGLVLYGNYSFAGGAGVVLDSYDEGGTVALISNDGAPSVSDIAFNFMTYDNGNYTNRVHIKKDGKVVIGSSILNNTPGDYKLYVESGIMTPKLKIALTTSTDWADYVFAEDYNLMPLNEVEKYIAENKHLPEVPSADEVVEQGIDLAKMNAKLLQKIEELTLHAIQQQKEIDALKEKVK